MSELEEKLIISDSYLIKYSSARVMRNDMVRPPRKLTARQELEYETYHKA